MGGEEDKFEPALVVEPTSIVEVDGKRIYTDIALTNLFACHVQKLNVEKQLIWQRYTAMLLANSVLVGLLGVNLDSLGPGSSNLREGICVLGIVLCVLWLVVTFNGWEIAGRRLKAAARFEWPGFPSPIGTRLYPEWTGIWDWIRNCAVAAILVFVYFYIALLWEWWPFG